MTETPSVHEATETPRKRPWPPWPLAIAAIIAILTAGVAFTIGNTQESTRADTAETVATDQATTLDRLCATDADVARRIPDDCREAQEIRQNVVLPASAPGPSQAQVQGWVDDWLDAHPPKDGEDATPEMVARAVAEHMAGNGQDQITAVAQAYLAANAERFRGPAGADGTDGQDGQNATDDQVATAVAAFCAEHGQCQGPQGETGGRGPQGQGVIDAQPIRNGDGQCEWVVTFENPETGERSETRHPAGDAACPAVQPPAPEETGGGLLPGG